MSFKKTLEHGVLLGATLLATNVAEMQKSEMDSPKKVQQEQVHHSQLKLIQENIDSSCKAYYHNGQLRAEFPACPDGVVPDNVSYDVFDESGRKIQTRTQLRKEIFKSKTIRVDDLAFKLEEAKKLPEAERDEFILNLLQNYTPKETTQSTHILNQWRVSLYDKDQKSGGSYTLEDTDFICRDNDEGSSGWKTGYLRSYSLPDANGEMKTYEVKGNFALKRHLSIAQLKFIDTNLEQQGKRVEVDKVDKTDLSKISALNLRKGRDL